MLDQDELNQFIGRMDQWKEWVSQEIKEMMKKIDGFATKDDHKTLEQELKLEIEKLKLRLDRQKWFLGVLVVIITCGEMAIHHLALFFPWI